MKDLEVAEGLKINSQVAKSFHGVKLEELKHASTIDKFIKFMQLGQDFRKDDSDPGDTLWNALRALQGGNQIP